MSRCAELLAELPAELLARAAFRAGAHARALRGFEVHVRAKAGGGGGLNPAASRSAAFEHADVSFLQAQPLDYPWIEHLIPKPELNHRACMSSIRPGTLLYVFQPREPHAAYSQDFRCLGTLDITVRAAAPRRRFMASWRSRTA